MTKRRVTLVGLALAFLLLEPAVGQEGWREYSYPDKRFEIQFPAAPEASSGVYSAATPSGSAVSAPALVLSLRQAGTTYIAKVADLSNTEAANPKALENALALIRARQAVALDTPVSMGNSSCGR